VTVTQWWTEIFCCDNNLHHVPEKRSHFNFRHNFATCNLLRCFYNFWSTLFRTNFCMVYSSLLHTHQSPPVWGLYLTWCNMTSVKLLTPDFIQPDLWPRTHWTYVYYFTYLLTYSVWSTLQEKAYQMNIDELKHWLVQVWAELDHRRRRLNACDTMCESSSGILWTTFAFNLHVALWSICWIVGYAIFNA